MPDTPENYSGAVAKLVRLFDACSSIDQARCVVNGLAGLTHDVIRDLAVANARLDSLNPPTK